MLGGTEMIPILYTIDGCHKCQLARRHLTSLSINYEEINILKVPQSAENIKSLVGEVVAPVFVSGDTILVGESILTY